LDPHRDRSLNQIYRNDQALIPVDGSQYTAHSVKASATDADALPYFQVRIWFERYFLLNDRSHRIDFVVWNWHANVPHADKTRHSVGAQNDDALAQGRHHPHEHVPRK